MGRSSFTAGRCTSRGRRAAANSCASVSSPTPGATRRARSPSPRPRLASTPPTRSPPLGLAAVTGTRDDAPDRARGKPHANLVIPRAAPRLPRGYVRPRRAKKTRATPATPSPEPYCPSVLGRGPRVPTTNRPPRPRPRRRRNRHPRNRPRSRSNPRSNPRRRLVRVRPRRRHERLRRRSRLRLARSNRSRERPAALRDDTARGPTVDVQIVVTELHANPRVSPSTERYRVHVHVKVPGERRQFLSHQLSATRPKSRGANAATPGRSRSSPPSRAPRREVPPSVTVARTGLWFFACAAEDAARELRSLASRTRYIASARLGGAGAVRVERATNHGERRPREDARRVTPRANVPGGGFLQCFSSLARSFAASFGFLRCRFSVDAAGGGDEMRQRYERADASSRRDARKGEHARDGGRAGRSAHFAFFPSEVHVLGETTSAAVVGVERVGAEVDEAQRPLDSFQRASLEIHRGEGQGETDDVVGGIDRVDRWDRSGRGGGVGVPG